MEKQMKKRAVRCEDCEWYDFDEETEEYGCMITLDEDESERVGRAGSRECPYFRFYDEYKSVQKQN
ncbi:MAG: DUF6472 family protein [Firmicutes bacterium]|nr:DUF6472 family protein [Bacillota bacterium]